MKTAVVGKMRSGKDTLSRFFVEKNDATTLAFGDAIKEIAERYFPDIVIKGKPRELYQFIGQKFREIDPDIWVKNLNRKLELFESLGFTEFVVTDVRQMNEYQYLKSEGFTVIKVEAHDEIRKDRIKKAGDIFKPENFYHETETAVDTIPYDYLIQNNTTIEEFYRQIELVYNELKGEESL